jgi:hypothetical protein
MKGMMMLAAGIGAMVVCGTSAVAGPGAGATMSRFGERAAQAAERRADAPAYALTGEGREGDTKLEVRPDIRGGRRVSGHYVRVDAD